MTMTVDREMDFDEERDFAYQGPLSDMDMEEDAQILATLLKHIPTSAVLTRRYPWCISARLSP